MTACQLPDLAFSYVRRAVFLLFNQRQCVLKLSQMLENTWAPIPNFRENRRVNATRFAHSA